jgi:hypothetical protein
MLKIIKRCSEAHLRVLDGFVALWIGKEKYLELRRSECGGALPSMRSNLARRAFGNSFEWQADI